MASILIIEDEENLRMSISRRLGREHEVKEAAALADARSAIGETEFDLILSDINLDGENAMDLVRGLRSEGFEGVIVLMTAYASVESAVEAMREGVDDYLQKPLRLDELSLTIERSLEQRRLRSRLTLFERLERVRRREDGPIGASEPWRRTMELSERLATLPLPKRGAGGPLPTILLLGETGVGKGLLARRIHELAESARRDRADEADKRGSAASDPFIHVNCASLPSALIESELFGHEKGAFTDARATREGYFELADGGTIFLDEIGEMAPELQSRLLLVLEQGRFRRVGGTRERSVSARVVTATNQDLEERVESGAFRRDLFFRLNAFTVPIPPLRERKEDIPLLAESLRDRFAEQLNRPARPFSDRAELAMRKHDWPGNVRELQNLVQRAVMLCDAEKIGPEDLGLDPRAASRHEKASVSSNGCALRFDFNEGIHTVDEVERALIAQALEHARGNVTRAARLVGMNRSSFRYRVQRAGLEGFVQEVAGR